MGLSASTMKSLIKSKLEALSALTGDGQISVVRDDILEALCEGIVEHIQGNAVVNTTGGDPQGGVVTSTGTVS